MRVASRLSGEDLEEGRGCIRDERWAGKGGLFSIIRTVSRWPVQSGQFPCQLWPSRQAKSNTINTSARDLHATRARPRFWTPRDPVESVGDPGHSGLPSTTRRPRPMTSYYSEAPISPPPPVPRFFLMSTRNFFRVPRCLKNQTFP
jgi:hypothetical protein